MITEVSRVNACVELKGIYVGEDGIEKVITKTFVLSLVETEAVDKILFGFVKNLNLHLTRSLM